MKLNLLEEIVKSTPKSSKKKQKNHWNLNMIGQETPFTSGGKELVLNQSSKVWWFVLLSLIVFVAVFMFAGKAFSLQLIEGDQNLELATENRVRISKVQAPRGVIYDRNGEVLVRNKPAFSIVLDADSCGFGSADPIGICLSQVKQVEDILAKLEIDASVQLEEIQTDISQGKKAVTIASNLTKEQIIPLEVNLKGLRNVSIAVTPQRDYLYKDAFAHLIGYVGVGDTLYPSIEGKEGVEAYYNDYLKGVDGETITQVNSAGEVQRLISEQKYVSGTDIYLNVDKDIQLKAYELLKTAVDEGEATGGAVVAQDVNTGGVIALVSYPSYDPQKLSDGVTSSELKQIEEGSYFPFFNRAISATYPPGSVFKMVMASAVLYENILPPSYQIIDRGNLTIGEFVFNNWKLDGHGPVDLIKALQVSNDTYFYTVGGGYGGIEGLGIKKIAEWSKKFGYGSKTGIDLHGEVAGFVPDGSYRDWYLGDTYITSIGQGDFLATPLQVNNATTYFANGGFLLKPITISKIDGVSTFDIEVINQNLISSEHYEIVREGMKVSVEPGGTGYPLFDFPIKYPGKEVAGKTGTSEYIDPQGEEKTHAWFTVFAPYENAEISITVFLEGGGSGSSDAAPIARELLDVYFK